MRTIQARSVTYKGARFRSTEEARWAAFFNRLGILFEYEKPVEGLYYLPDFYVPPQDLVPEAIYFEVKPVPNPVEEEKCSMLAALGNRVGVLRKMPRPTGNNSFDYFIHDKFFEGEGWDTGYAFCQCFKCGCFGFEYCGRSGRIGCVHYNPLGPEYWGGETDDLLCAYMHATTLKFN
jgi:hypothetical protein